MPFLGNTPAESYISFAKQDITGNGGTSYSLNHPVTNAADIELFVNNVQQEPTEAYTASGSTLTLSEAIASTDDCYCIFRGRSLQTVAPPDGSVTSAKLDANIAITASELTVNTSDQVLINHSANGGGIRIDSTNGTNTGSLRFGDDADNYIGAVEYNHSTNALSLYANNATRMTIDSSGRVTMPNQPAFHAYGNSGSWTVFSNGSWTQIAMNAAAFNTGTHYDTTNSKFVAPIAGVYHFYYKIYGRVQSGGGTSTYWQSRFHKNNSGITGYNSQIMAYQYTVGGVDEVTNYSMTIQLAANDEITVHAQAAGSSNGEYYPLGCEFGGHLVGQETDMALSKILTSSVADTVLQTNKNIIKNGAMVIAQRSTSVTGVTGGGIRVIDRMYPEISNAGTWTQSQSTDVPVGQGFVNSFKMDCTTADTSLDASHYNILGYRIEGIDLQRLNYGTSGAKNMVLSFWVKTSKTGNYVVNIQNIVTGGTSRTCGIVYTVSQANTWQKVEFPIAADTATAFDNDTALTAIIYWWLATGTTYTTGTLSNTWENISNPNIAAGQTVNLADSTNNNFYITGIQLEEADSISTPFEHEDYTTTLTKCRRYYQYLLGNSYFGGFVTYQGATSYYHQVVPQMRAAPSVTQYAVRNHSSGATANANANYSGVDGVNLPMDGAGGADTNGSHIAQAYIELAAEL